MVDQSWRPAKPWNVTWLGGNAEAYRSQRAAYEAVRSLTERGLEATVYHWEHGSWQLYERIEAAR